jgi:hypothetical protein
MKYREQIFFMDGLKGNYCWLNDSACQTSNFLYMFLKFHNFFTFKKRTNNKL